MKTISIASVCCCLATAAFYALQDEWATAWWAFVAGIWAFSNYWAAIHVDLLERAQKRKFSA